MGSNYKEQLKPVSQDLCRSRELKVSGNKAELVQRLEDYECDIAKGKNVAGTVPTSSPRAPDKSAESGSNCKEQLNAVLKDLCKDRELKVSGNKVELVQRLEDYDSKIAKGKKTADAVPSSQSSARAPGKSTEPGSNYKEQLNSALKDLCNSRKLKVSGNKAELVRRLEDYDRDNAKGKKIGDADPTSSKRISGKSTVTRRATKTARRLVQEIGYQAQRLYDDADRSYNSETVWEGRLVGRMKELDIKTESQVKIREYFKEYIPQPKFADILLEQKAFIELKIAETWPSPRDLNQLEKYMRTTGCSHGAVICFSQRKHPALMAQMLVKTSSETPDGKPTYVIHPLNLFKASKLSDPMSGI